MAALGTDFALVCPAFPENGRTVYRGHLFVGDQLGEGGNDYPVKAIGVDCLAVSRWQDTALLMQTILEVT